MQISTLTAVISLSTLQRKFLS